jgi:putative DNA primase/helicase
VHRSVLCRIDAKVERPEERVFEENFEETIAQNRTQLVVAALTMLRAYHVAGRPKQTIPLGGFEQWSRLVRDALIWVRCADPVSTQQQLRDNDPQRARLFTVMELWGAMFGEDRVTAKEAVRAVAHTDTWDPNETEEQKAARETRRQLRQDFESALMEIAGEGKTISTRRLGTWLGRNKEALVNGRRFEQDGITMGDTLWVLRKV